MMSYCGFLLITKRLRKDKVYFKVNCLIHFDHLMRLSTFNYTKSE